MKLNKSLVGVLASVLLSTSILGVVVQSPINTTRVQAASSFTAAEIARINQINQNYNKLSQQEYSANNAMFSTIPIVKNSFSAGILQIQVLNQYTDWINYYRNLAGLPALTNSAILNTESQYGAATLASLNQGLHHGFTGLTKPNFVSQAEWDRGSTATASSNLGWQPSPASAKEMAELYLFDTDVNNTGHRAWILSSYQTKFGFGVSQSPDSSMLFTDMYVVDDDSNLETPVKKVVTYPSEGVFPYESTQAQFYAKEFYWSVYFTNANKPAAGSWSVSIKNNTTGQVSAGTNLTTADGYGNFQRILSYKPSGVTLTPGNSYTVTINGLSDYPAGYSYSFKLFSIGQDPSSEGQVTTFNNTATINYVSGYGINLWNGYGSKATYAGRKLNHGTHWKVYKKAIVNGATWYNVGGNQWIMGQYAIIGSSANSAEVAASGTVTINYVPGYGVNLWNGYGTNAVFSGRRLLHGSRWKIFKKVNINGTIWYNVGGNQWINGNYVK